MESFSYRAWQDGYYLARAWSGRHGGAAGTLEGTLGMSCAKNVREAQAAVRQVTISCNWLLADRHGSIAYQQSGLLPARRHSGLYPVPGWREDLAWGHL